MIRKNGFVALNLQIFSYTVIVISNKNGALF